MKTTVEIADPLFHQIRQLATEQRVNLRALVEEGLHSVLEARRSATVPVFRLRDGSFKGGCGLQPGVDWQDLAALAHEDAPQARKARARKARARKE